jgi:hypothetical protein
MVNAVTVSCVYRGKVRTPSPCLLDLDQAAACMARAGAPGVRFRATRKEAAQRAVSFVTVTRLFYWQGYVLPSSSLTVVPGRQTMPFCFA